MRGKAIKGGTLDSMAKAPVNGGPVPKTVGPIPDLERHLPTEWWRTLFNSIWFIAMIIVGGMGSITGALIGVVAIRLVQEIITVVGPQIASQYPALGGDIVFAAMNIFLGGIIACFLIFEPKGLMHRWSILKRSYRLWPFPY